MSTDREGDDEGFIGRWSRRKTQISTPGGLKKKSPEVVEPVRGRMITEPLPVAPLEPEQAAAEADKNVEVAVLNDGSQSELAAQAETSGEDTEVDISELESIDIEALDFDADFTKFMQAGVPERLRQRALRRLWSTNPILANVDGLNDYDEDFTDAALAVDTLKTAWKVGQGYLTDEEVAERDAERLPEEAEDNDLVESTEVENEDPEAITEADQEPTATDLDKVAEETMLVPTDADGSDAGDVEPDNADPDHDTLSQS